MHTCAAGMIDGSGDGSANVRLEGDVPVWAASDSDGGTAADEERLGFVRQHILEQAGVSRRVDLVMFNVGGTGRLATGGKERGKKPWYTL